jgi:hypothetical protein
MSDLGLPSRPSPSPAPSDDTLAAALRDAVKRIFDAGDLSELTVKRVRAAAERKLQLPEDFFKGHPEWRGKSKEIVEAEAVSPASCEYIVALPFMHRPLGSS